MRKRRRIFQTTRRLMVVAVILVLGVPLWPGDVFGQAALPAPLVEEVSGHRAYEHVLAIAQKIGPHVAGTPADRTSGEYIAAQIRADGYAVEWQPFPFHYFGVSAVDLAVPSEAALALHPRAMIYSPSSPAGGIAAELVDAGAGRAEDVAGKALAGKIALIARNALPFRDKAMNVASAGALAAIIYNSRPEEFIGTLGAGMKIPVVSLPGTEGLQLLDLVHSGRIVVRLRVETVNETRTTWNIIGTKPGVRDPRRVFVVGAHRDTVEAAPGADDNTSGVAVVLDIAQALRRAPLATTVKFVLFGAEEFGLLGSEYYVHHMGSDDVSGMLNLDMEGAGERLQLARDRGPDTLVALAARLAGQLGIKTEAARTGRSDHVSFDRVGIPVVFLVRPDYTYLHTPKDTVDRIDPTLLETSARLAAAIVLAVAGAVFQ